MKKVYAILNLVSVVGVVWWNYYVNAYGINGNTVGSLSDKYYNLFTPAGYAFSIWGVIFLALLCLGIYLVKKFVVDGSQADTILRLGPWFIIANICNALWLWFWLNENTGTSVWIMLVMLFSLLLVMIRLGMTILPVSKADKRWVSWPIELYAGWITVATIANISANLAKNGWSGWFDPVTWTVIMIVVAAIIYYLVLKSQRSFVFTAVGVWAFAAIAVRHWDAQPAIQWTALAACIMLLGNIFVQAGKKV